MNSFKGLMDGPALELGAKVTQADLEGILRNVIDQHLDKLKSSAAGGRENR